MKLGRLIELLERVPDTAVALKYVDDQGEVVRYATPGELISWRGSYEQTTLAPFEQISQPIDSRSRARTHAHYLRSQIGATMQGYKGGDYMIDSDITVWADEYGSAGGWQPVSVHPEGGAVVIACFQVDLW